MAGTVISKCELCIGLSGEGSSILGGRVSLPFSFTVMRITNAGRLKRKKPGHRLENARSRSTQKASMALVRTRSQDENNLLIDQVGKPGDDGKPIAGW